METLVLIAAFFLGAVLGLGAGVHLGMNYQRWRVQNAWRELTQRMTEARIRANREARNGAQNRPEGGERPEVRG